MSRGLLVSDHLAKSHIGILKDFVVQKFAEHMRPSQYGGVPGGSTDVPHHTISSSLNYSQIYRKSIFIIFLDLEKAFDKVLRELVLGYPQHLPPTDDARREYLASIGLSGSVADWIHLYTVGGWS